MGRDGQVGKAGISPELADAIERFAEAAKVIPTDRPGPDWFTVYEFARHMATKGVTISREHALRRLRAVVEAGEAETFPSEPRKGVMRYYRLLPSSEGK